jgi:hypothetical protein
MPVAGGASVMDAISVPDNFTVGTVSVSDINVAHTHVGALQVSQQIRYIHSRVCLVPQLEHLPG